MKFSCKYQIIMSILFCLFLVVSGCSSGSDESVESGASPEEDSEEQTEEQVDFPERTITWQSWSSAGSPGDIYSRQMSQALEEELNETVVVENITGAGGAVALSNLLSESEDGYTINQATQSMMVGFHQGLFPDFEPDDFEYIARVQQDPYLLAVPADAEYEDFEDFVRHVQDHPGDFQLSGFTVGSSPHLAYVELSQLVDIEVEWVPYDGAADSVTALLGGHVDGVFTNPSVILGQIESEDVKVLAVTSEERLDILPDVPTVEELGYDYTAGQWRGVLAKKGVPEEIIEVYEEAIKNAIESESFQEYLNDTATTAAYLDHDEFTAFVKEELETLGALMQETEGEED